MGKLTAAQVRHAKPGRRWATGAGLYLQVSRRLRERGSCATSTGSASAGWTSARPEFVSLAQAREAGIRVAAAAERMQGMDPLERRRAAVVGARLAALERGHVCGGGVSGYASTQ